MEPDVAAICLAVSPFRLAIPHSFFCSVTNSVKSERTKGLSPYGNSPHSLLSTDSLVQLLPITNVRVRPHRAAHKPSHSVDQVSVMDPVTPALEPTTPSPDWDLSEYSIHPVWHPCLTFSA